MDNILIFGGGGYVGLPLTNFLLNKGSKVTIVDNFIYDHQHLSSYLLGNSKINILNFDIRNDNYQNQLIDAIREATCIIYLVGLVGDPITKKYPEFSEDINKNSLARLIKYCFDVSTQKNMIFVSTCSNYGLLPEGQIATEETDLVPLSLYAKHKVEMEKQFLNLSKGTKNCSTVLRFATAFGLSPRMRFDLTVNQFVVEIASRKDLLVFDPDTWRPYCHVNDFARLIERVLSVDAQKVDQQIYNAGSDENNFTKRQLVELISSKVDKSNVSFKEHGSDPRNYKVSFEKVSTELGFKAISNVEFGVDEILFAYNKGYFNDFSTNYEKYGNHVILG